MEVRGVQECRRPEDLYVCGRPQPGCGDGATPRHGMKASYSIGAEHFRHREIGLDAETSRLGDAAPCVRVRVISSFRRHPVHSILHS